MANRIIPPEELVQHIRDTAEKNSTTLDAAQRKIVAMASAGVFGLVEEVGLEMDRREKKADG